MPKNIALFIDGTWNEPVFAYRKSNTNVRKLFDAAENHPGQRCLYLNGIGTDPPSYWYPSKLKGFLPRNLAGGAFGFGMSNRIKDAYQFLSRNYDRGDHVYLFGFSRGAFAARSLAGFVDTVGLLFRDRAYDRNLVEMAYALYENDADEYHSEMWRFLRPMQDSGVLPKERESLPIYFIGVWDTVATLGLSVRKWKFAAQFTEFHQTHVPANVSYARHALAIHELRGKFPARLWHDSRGGTADKPRLQQMWFPGAHSNVGGGYWPSHWSDAALDWMAGEASTFGLELRTWPRAGPPACPGVSIENSSAGGFALLPKGVREQLIEPATVDPQTAETFDVHPFVIDRLFESLHLPYSFRDAIADRLTAADWCTLRLIGVCSILARGDAASLALRRAMNRTAADVAHLHTALDGLLARTGPVSRDDMLPLLRAAIVDAAGAGTFAQYAAAIKARGAISSRTTPLEPIRGLANRLLEAAQRIVDMAAPPDQGTDQVAVLANCLLDRGQSLRANVRIEQLRRMR